LLAAVIHGGVLFASVIPLRDYPGSWYVLAEKGQAAPEESGDGPAAFGDQQSQRCDLLFLALPTEPSGANA
jgi:hypothetical protein